MRSTKNPWDGHIIKISIDATNEQFIGTIVDIKDREVTFFGHNYKELQEDFYNKIDIYIKSPDKFTKKLYIHSLFRKFLTQDEINRITDFYFINTEDINSPIHQLKHPVYALIIEFEKDKPSSIAINTHMALAAIYKFCPTYLTDNNYLKKRLLDKKDYTQAASALAEIRAFGSLCFTESIPTAIKEKKDKKTPDFELAIEKSHCFIEVHTRISTSDNERVFPELVDKINNTISNCMNIRLERISNVAPFGQPCEEKADTTEGVSTNIISKICSVKSNEEQFNKDNINILWIDLQDSETLGNIVTIHQCIPYFMDRRPLPQPYTGCIWHAFYGKKGDPIIENKSMSSFKIITMPHNGRFITNKSNINFAVISIPDGLIVFENPHRSNMKDIDNIRKAFYKMPLFSAQYSIINTRHNIIDSILDIQRAQRDYCFKTFKTLSL